ncbi:MAG: hypothetical protein DLM58_19355 [Pseudonocardiales bacterium]|nr:MAG: hypothetical protein DLM58_19355 [Pseudonocardiales bacterium]
MTTDFDERLATVRPTPRWSAAEQETVLNAVLSADPADSGGASVTPLGSRCSRRTAVIAAVAGLAAAAAIAAPALLPSGSPGSTDPASAQALRRLAHVAAGGPVLHIRPGQYIHLVLTGHTDSSPGQPLSDVRYEYWTDASGKTWQRRDEIESGDFPDTHEVWVTKPGGDVGQIQTQRDLERLPTDPVALRAYLDKHGENASSRDERIFLAVGTILRGGMAPPALRSAAIEVLASLRHVSIGSTTHDRNGNPVQEFVFEDQATRSNERWALLFDTRTAQITEERDYFHGNLQSRGDVTGLGIVNAVPAGILASAKPQN